MGRNIVDQVPVGSCWLIVARAAPTPGMGRNVVEYINSTLIYPQRGATCATVPKGRRVHVHH
eukprot:9810383-Karenia_brevis.AAC.1